MQVRLCALTMRTFAARASGVMRSTSITVGEVKKSSRSLVARLTRARRRPHLVKRLDTGAKLPGCRTRPGRPVIDCMTTRRRSSEPAPRRRFKTMRFWREPRSYLLAETPSGAGTTRQFPPDRSNPRGLSTRHRLPGDRVLIRWTALPGCFMEAVERGQVAERVPHRLARGAANVTDRGTHRRSLPTRH